MAPALQMTLGLLKRCAISSIAPAVLLTPVLALAKMAVQHWPQLVHWTATKLRRQFGC